MKPSLHLAFLLPHTVGHRYTLPHMAQTVGGCVHVPVEARGRCWVSSLVTMNLSWRQGFSWNLESVDSHKLVVSKLQESSWLCLPRPPSCPEVLVGVGDLNSAPHAYMAGVQPSKPPPQSKNGLLFNTRQCRQVD